MIKNYYLKTETEQDLWDALEAVDLAMKVYDPNDPLNFPPTFLESDGEEIQHSEWSTPQGAFTYHFTGIALDIIGTIKDNEGNPIPGFHANIIATQEDAEKLPTLQTEPKTPYRVWA